jgi:hypothetical protein
MEDDRNGMWPWKPLSPEDLADMIRNDPNWNNRPVMLGACGTGTTWGKGHGGRAEHEPFAQTLANLLGVPVTAPLGFSRYSAQGGLLGSTPTMTGPVTWPGQWHSFFPMN